MTMYKRCLTLLMALMCFCLQNLFAANPPPKLHICTVATQEIKGLNYLRKSCERYNLPLHVIGLGQPFPGRAYKLHAYEQYAKTLPKNDIVLFVDGYDVIFLADEKTILETFYAMNHPFVISVERNCYPYPELARLFPRDTSFRYINAGSYIGYAGNVAEILKGLRPYDFRWNDQGLLMIDYLQQPEKYRLDTFCQLFLVLTLVKPTQLIIDEEHQQVLCRETGTLPCLLHGNGWSKDMFYSICKKFYPEVPTE